MNYLAHIYLSGENELIRIGNFFADHVKGRSYEKFHADVQKGILLHRQIDSFTDAHPIVKRSKGRLGSRYGLYRGIVVDIFYDHMLAKNWSHYSAVPLADFSGDFYGALLSHYDMLPEKVQYMSKYLIPQDWLSSYAEIEGIEKVLHGMDRRTQGRSGMSEAGTDLKANYLEFEEDFTLFFEKLRNFSAVKLAEIQKQYP